MKIFALILTAAFMVIAVTSAPAMTAASAGQDQYLRNHGFKIEIDGADAGQFRSVSGIKAETEVVEYQEGGSNMFTKRPGRTKYSNIILKRGFVNDPALIEWYQRIIGSGNRNETGLRKDISVIILNSDNSEARRYNYFDCFPVSYSLPQLNADKPQLELAETLEITCGRLDLR